MEFWLCITDPLILAIIIVLLDKQMINKNISESFELKQILHKF